MSQVLDVAPEARHIHLHVVLLTFHWKITYIFVSNNSKRLKKAEQKIPHNQKSWCFLEFFFFCLAHSGVYLLLFGSCWSTLKPVKDWLLNFSPPEGECTFSGSFTKQKTESVWSRFYSCSTKHMKAVKAVAGLEQWNNRWVIIYIYEFRDSRSAVTST